MNKQGKIELLSQWTMEGWDEQFSEQLFMAQKHIFRGRIVLFSLIYIMYSDDNRYHLFEQWQYLAEFLFVICLIVGWDNFSLKIIWTFIIYVKVWLCRARTISRNLSVIGSELSKLCEKLASTHQPLVLLSCRKRLQRSQNITTSQTRKGSEHKYHILDCQTWTQFCI